MTRQDFEKASRQVRTMERKAEITPADAKRYLNIIEVRYLRLSALRRQYEAGQK